MKLKSLGTVDTGVSPDLVLGLLRSTEERLVRRLAETTMDIQKLQESREALTTELVNVRFDIREVGLMAVDATVLQRETDRVIPVSDSNP